MDDFVAEFGVTHPLAILGNDALEKLIGVDGYPTSAVFSGGELIWTGHPSAAGSAVGKALKDAKKGSVFPKSLAKARQHIQAKRHAEAYAEARKVVAKAGADAAWAARVQGWLEQESVAALAGAQADAAAGFLYRGMERVRPFGGAESALPNAAEIQAWMAATEAGTPEFKKEMSGGKAYEEALALEKQLQFTEAFKAYKSLMGRAKGTRIGAAAEQAARAILDGHKAGYNEHCESCEAKEHRACARHREELKL